jgi:hypothetical protein
MTASKWTKIVVLALAVAAVPAIAFSQGRGNGNGGGPGEETGNSLSVPAILIGGSPELAYPIGAAVPPTGLPLSGFPINPSSYFYVQGVHKWQASTISLDPDPSNRVEVLAAWGDNLTGDASLKTNSPIRVEIGLLAPDETVEALQLTGWTVVKLEPDKLDREAAYGTLASRQLDGTFVSYPVTPYDELRVYDDQAYMTITNVDTDEVIVDGPASSEVNATGRIIYGYNLRVTTAGTYRIQFMFPNVNIVDKDGGVISNGGTTVTLDIVVKASKGKGGGRP